MSMLVAMCLFSLSMSISPGPVNMTILSSGVNYGFRRAFSIVSGATIGFVLLLIVVGLGLSNIVAQVPFFYDLLRYAGSCYMIVIGYKILTARPDMKTTDAQELNYRHGFLMQWLNPKAWIACLSGVSAFGLNDSYSMLTIFVCIYFPICYLSLSAWAFIGVKLVFLTRMKNGIRWFNIAMGGMLMLVAVYLLLSRIP